MPLGYNIDTWGLPSCLSFNFWISKLLYRASCVKCYTADYSDIAAMTQLMDGLVVYTFL